MLDVIAGLKLSGHSLFRHKFDALLNRDDKNIRILTFVFMALVPTVTASVSVAGHVRQFNLRILVLCSLREVMLQPPTQ